MKTFQKSSTASELKSKYTELNPRDNRGCSAGRAGLFGLIVGALAFAAFAAPVQAAVVLPGTRVQLTWTSLGAGTSYYVETSTNLSAWTASTNTAATNTSLSFVGGDVRLFRMWASNAPPQSATLAWDSSIPVTGVTGYYLYYGTTTGNYTNRIDVGLATNSIANNLLAGGTYYFVTTAYNSSGLESGYSNEAVWNCPLQVSIKQLP